MDRDISRLYESFRGLPVRDRQELYRRLDPATRRALWIEQLSRVQKDNPDISRESRNVLSDALRLLREPRTLSWFGEHGYAGLPREEQETVDDLQRRINALPREMARWFDVLGPDLPPCRIRKNA